MAWNWQISHEQFFPFLQRNFPKVYRHLALRLLMKKVKRKQIILSIKPFQGKKENMEFFQVKKGLEEKTFVLVDVRNQDELQSVGKIPGSINIPRKFLLRLNIALHFNSIFKAKNNCRQQNAFCKGTLWRSANKWRQVLKEGLTILWQNT